MEDLRIAVGDLQIDTRALHEALAAHTRSTRRWARMLAVLIAIFAVSGLVGAWQLHRQVTDQRILCPVILLQVPRAGEALPTTERGRQQAETFRDLSHKLHCS